MVVLCCYAVAGAPEVPLAHPSHCLQPLRKTRRELHRKGFYRFELAADAAIVNLAREFITSKSVGNGPQLCDE